MCLHGSVFIIQLKNDRHPRDDGHCEIILESERAQARREEIPAYVPGQEILLRFHISDGLPCQIGFVLLVGLYCHKCSHEPPAICTSIWCRRCKKQQGKFRRYDRPVVPTNQLEGVDIGTSGILSFWSAHISQVSFRRLRVISKSIVTPNLLAIYVHVSPA